MKFYNIKDIENKVPKQGSFKHYLRTEEAAGVGIVTKQNATKDVPVGGEYMNVKKLGLGKGKPKQHSKKTKGSKTNVLFNLGMAETKADDPRQQQIAKRRINDLQQAMMLNNKLKSRWEQTFPPGKYQYPIESDYAQKRSNPFCAFKYESERCIINYF